MTENWDAALATLLCQDAHPGGRHLVGTDARPAKDAQPDGILATPEGRDHPVVTRLADASPRSPVRITACVVSAENRPWLSCPAWECCLDDGTGRLLVVFLGRDHVAGIDVGTSMSVEGRVVVHHGRHLLLNPAYALHQRTVLQGANTR